MSKLSYLPTNTLECWKKTSNQTNHYKGPGERFVVDLVDIDEDINDAKRTYKYILNIIDHYSKLVGSYLLKNKNANEVLIKINDFISHYETPKILQADHCKEFDNKLLKEYCKTNNI